MLPKGIETLEDFIKQLDKDLTGGHGTSGDDETDVKKEGEE